MPDYQIKEWNEENYDVTKNDFIKEAYQLKKWAFVSDYVRFDVVYKYGGVYFDTDVELLKPIPKEILEQKVFTGFESAGTVNPGLVYAAVKHDSMTKRFLEKYEVLHFSVNGKPNYITVNTIVTDILGASGLVQDDSFQIVDEVAIYPSSVFCGYDQDVKEIDIREDTISVHHYAGTWTKRTKKQKVQACLKRVFGVEGYRKMLKFYRKIRKNVRIQFLKTTRKI